MTPEKRTPNIAGKEKTPEAAPAAETTAEPGRSIAGAADLHPSNPDQAQVSRAEEPKAPPAKPPGPVEGPPIPPILLETDPPAAPQVSGPGERYALGPTTHPERPGRVGTEEELPESYGTGRVFLTARDPHWLHVAWDLTADQQEKLNALSASGHLMVRIYQNSVGGKPQHEVHVQPESRSWFIHVAQAGTKYWAELGYRNRVGQWQAIAVSTAALTPPDGLSEDRSVQFAAMPAKPPVEELLEILTTVTAENVPFVEAVQQLRSQGYTTLPPVSPRAEPTTWTPDQERALAEFVSQESVRRSWMGSMEITELIGRRLPQEVSSITAAQPGFGGPELAELLGISSPFAGARPAPGAPRPRAFWFNINAELIVYGATEPDAKVALGGRFIKLRPDGTFSVRFALPDGQYPLPALAISADGEDARLAMLQFGRQTAYTGEVGVHPQDAQLQAPATAGAK